MKEATKPVTPSQVLFKGSSPRHERNTVSEISVDRSGVPQSQLITRDLDGEIIHINRLLQPHPNQLTEENRDLSTGKSQRREEEFFPGIVSLDHKSRALLIISIETSKQMPTDDKSEPEKVTLSSQTYNLEFPRKLGEKIWEQRKASSTAQSNFPTRRLGIFPDHREIAEKAERETSTSSEFLPDEKIRKTHQEMILKGNKVWSEGETRQLTPMGEEIETIKERFDAKGRPTWRKTERTIDSEGLAAGICIDTTIEKFDAKGRLTWRKNRVQERVDSDRNLRELATKIERFKYKKNVQIPVRLIEIEVSFDLKDQIRDDSSITVTNYDSDGNLMDCNTREHIVDNYDSEKHHVYQVNTNYQSPGDLLARVQTTEQEWFDQGKMSTFEYQKLVFNKQGKKTQILTVKPEFDSDGNQVKRTITNRQHDSSGNRIKAETITLNLDPETGEVIRTVLEEKDPERVSNLLRRQVLSTLPPELLSKIPELEYTKA